MESKKTKQTKQNQIHRYKEQTGGCQNAGGGGMGTIGEEH